jgi:predicted deacylase
MSNRIVRIGSIEAEPGNRIFDYLPIRLPTEIRTSIPVGIINGSNSGPVLCLLAGHHGLEYAGIEAVIRTYKGIDPKELNGALVTVPVVNLLGFQTKTPYLCPVDGVNIARIYPGNPNGTLGYVIAHTVLNDIVAKANYAMDCHGADVWESLAPFALFCKGENKEIAAKSEGMAKAHGLPYYAVTDYGMRLYEEAHKRGVPMILAEIGEVEWEGTAVNMHLTGIQNVMKHLGMIKGTPKPLQSPRDISSNKEFGVRTRCGGIWYPQVKAGDTVSKGQVLGEVRDLDGEVKETLHAPCNGFIHFQWTFHVLEPGFQVITITRD